MINGAAPHKALHGLFACIPLTERLFRIVVASLPNVSRHISLASQAFIFVSYHCHP